MSEDYYAALAQELEENRRETDRLRAEVAGTCRCPGRHDAEGRSVRARHYELSESVDILWDMGRQCKLEMHGMEAILRHVRDRQLDEEGPEAPASAERGRSTGGSDARNKEDAT
ncbi:hypothetical protein PG994_011958 [Apiospora phragmitis]|uniref:Uncharacterized protein n=1 Tax=Apiospora phragmitis TaxID=2905665 RepID=A0ABR1TUJ0_9PEZI